MTTIFALIGLAVTIISMLAIVVIAYKLGRKLEANKWRRNS